VSNTYTDDEFKKVLKNLFSEKKRVKDLQKQLEERGIAKKFQSKLGEAHKLSIAAEYAQLKSDFLEKEKENRHFKNQLERVRPALKKLVDALKHTREELEDERKKAPDDLAAALEKTATLEKQIETLQEEHLRLQKEQDESVATRQRAVDLEAQLQKIQEAEHKEVQRFESEKNKLVERLAEALAQGQRQAKELKELEMNLNAVAQRAESSEHSLEQFETLKQEHTLLNKHVAHIEEEIERERQAFAYQAREWETRDAHYKRIYAELEEAKAQLQETDLASVREEYEAKLKQEALKAEKTVAELCKAHEEHLLTKQKEATGLIEHLNLAIVEARAERDHLKAEFNVQQEEYAQLMGQKEQSQEQKAEGYYAKMKELSARHAEMVEKHERLQKQWMQSEKELPAIRSALHNATLRCNEQESEIHKGQQHLAKKVKESTLLRDLAERQKEQLLELQASIDQQKNQIDQMQNRLNLQQMHEEKLQAMAKERAQSAEESAKEWQNKFLSMQQDWQEQKTELVELQKMRQQYDQMASTVSNLKNILGKNALEQQVEQKI